MSDLHYQGGAGDADDRDTASERPPGAFLTLGHVLAGIGAQQTPPIGLDDIHLIRHSFKTGDANGLRGPEDLTEERVREYTRAQGISTRQFPAKPARYWVVLISDGQRRSRLYGTFENLGEIVAERTATYRYWDLRPSSFLAPLADRLWWSGALPASGIGVRRTRRTCPYWRSPTGIRCRFPASTVCC